MGIISKFSIGDKVSKKQERSFRVLLGIVSLYIKVGKPIGSHTLKENGFQDLSSATIRNYFMELEKQGYLMQQHSSGGRIPTNAAFRVYAQEHYEDSVINKSDESAFRQVCDDNTKEVSTQLQAAAEVLSGMTNTAVFLSAPRFDNDFVADIKLMSIDASRCLCVIVTDFGLVRTEILHTDEKLSSFSLKRIEGYFHWRLTGLDRPEDLSKPEEILAQEFYNEVMVRYIVNYANFTHADLCTLGFSRLLNYPDFNDAELLASSLILFEDVDNLRLLLSDCQEGRKLRIWIGEDLEKYMSEPPSCSVLAIPYSINQNVVGAVGLLGPARMDYPKMFGVLQSFSKHISDFLTRSVVKFKLTYRKPKAGKYVLTDKSTHLLIEKK